MLHSIALMSVLALAPTTLGSDDPAEVEIHETSWGETPPPDDMSGYRPEATPGDARVTGTLAPRPAGHRFVFSAVGPGEGHGAVGLGGRVFLILPTFDINYARGITDNLDVILNASTLGIITLADVGIRYRFVGGADSGFSMAVKAAATPFLFFVAVADGAAGSVAFAATPGLVASFGGETVQFSLGVDVPMLLAGATAIAGGGSGATSSGTGFEPIVRPSATIEFPVSDTTNMYIQASAYVAPQLDGFVMGPIMAVGASW